MLEDSTCIKAKGNKYLSLVKTALDLILPPNAEAHKMFEQKRLFQLKLMTLTWEESISASQPLS